MDTLLRYPRNAVYALINDSDRRVYVSYSVDVLLAIRRLLVDYAVLDADYKSGKLRIAILETASDKRTMQLYVEHYQIKYESLGYSFYKRNKFIQYKVQITIESDRLVYVFLVSRNYSKLIVGIFSKMDQARAFKAVLESSNPVLPVFALNGHTRRHCLGLPLDRGFTVYNTIESVKSKYNRIEDETDDVE